MRTALFWVIAQRVLIISYRHFGTTYHSDLQRSRIFTLEDWNDRLSRASVRNYLFSRDKPEERSSQIFLCSVLSKFISFNADQ
jgi:hypothetical protein